MYKHNFPTAIIFIDNQPSPLCPFTNYFLNFLVDYKVSTVFRRFTLVFRLLTRLLDGQLALPICSFSPVKYRLFVEVTSCLKIIHPTTSLGCNT